MLRAVRHLVPNAYGLRIFGPPQLVPNWLIPLDRRSPTNSVPMDEWGEWGKKWQNSVHVVVEWPLMVGGRHWSLNFKIALHADFEDWSNKLGEHQI